MKGLGEMQNEQVEYYLVNKNTRHLLQIDFPNDVDEFNRIMGTSEGKGSLLKDLGIVLNNENKIFSNPEPIKTECKKVINEANLEVAKDIKKAKVKSEKQKATKQKQEATMPTSVNLFAGIFD